jgi:hypothetical protein
MYVTTEPIAEKAAAVPDGLHHRRGVEYLAAAAGMEPDNLSGPVVFGEDLGFSEATGFFRESKGRGYWMTTLNECSCPSFLYRGGPCKHQNRLADELQRRPGPSLPAGVVPLSSEDLEARRARIEERTRQRATAPKVEETRGRGFSMPPEDWR